MLVAAEGFASSIGEAAAGNGGSGATGSEDGAPCTPADGSLENSILSASDDQQEQEQEQGEEGGMHTHTHTAAVSPPSVRSAFSPPPVANAAATAAAATVLGSGGSGSEPHPPPVPSFALSDNTFNGGVDANGSASNSAPSPPQQQQVQPLIHPLPSESGESSFGSEFGSGVRRTGSSSSRRSSSSSSSSTQVVTLRTRSDQERKAKEAALSGECTPASHSCGSRERTCFLGWLSLPLCRYCVLSSLAPRSTPANHYDACGINRPL